MGPVGPQGEPGPPGGLIEYAYYYNVQQLILQTNSIVQFDNLPISSGGIIYTNGNVTLTNGGIYRISFYVFSNQTGQFALYLNGNVIPESVYDTYNGMCLKAFSPNSVIALVNTTNSQVIIPIANNNGLYIGINATLLVERVA
jgi:hypothetical protein